MFKLALHRPRPPRLHAKYDVACELGKGGCGVIWKGLSREDGQVYAIKIVKSDQITNAVTREIAILQTLSHPNICGMKDTIREDGPEGSVSECKCLSHRSVHYLCHIKGLVLELVPGGDLFDYIEAYGPLSVSHSFAASASSTQHIFITAEFRTRFIIHQICCAMKVCTQPIRWRTAI